MLEPPKLLKVVTSIPTGQPYMRLEFEYGVTGFAGNLVLRLEDLAEFIEALRAGFDDHLAISKK